MADDGGSREPLSNGITTDQPLPGPSTQPHLLPPGWWVKTSAGSFSGPPVQGLESLNMNDDDDDDDSITLDDDNEDSRSIGENELDINPDSDGWEDTGSPDVENISIQCLLCDASFTKVLEMLVHCIEVHDFDFVRVVKETGLDFYATIRYINLVRRNLLNGVSNPTAFGSEADLQGEELMRPTLEDDALLYLIEDAVEFETG